MSVILAHGSDGGGVGQQLNSVTILDTATETVDAVPVVDAFSVKWLVTMENATDNKWLTEEVNAMHRNGASPDHNRISKLGDNIRHTVTVAIVGGNMELQITNDDGNTIVVDAVRIEVFA